MEKDQVGTYEIKWKQQPNKYMGKEDKLMGMIQHKDASDKSTNRQPNTRTEAVRAEEEK